MAAAWGNIKFTYMNSWPVDMALELTQRVCPDVPLEADTITPDRLSGLGHTEIEKLPLHYGNQPCLLADFFAVSGNADDRTVRISGDLSKVKFLGAQMTHGSLHIEGDVGPHLGAGMRGGEIRVEGNADDWVGPEMSGGRIIIYGDAGHMIGSAYRGAATGMCGGEIIIHGSARNEVGHAMRNGLIAIAGNSGDFTGVNMLAGTIMVLGELGLRTGAGMKRGSIVSLKQAELLPTFTYACTWPPAFLRMYFIYLQQLGLALTAAHKAGSYRRFCGDGVELNKGEILLYAG